MSAVNDVFSYLEAQGIAGGSTLWALLRRRETDEPDTEQQLVVVAEDGGPEPEIPATEGIGDSALYDVGVLITVRAAAWDGDASAAKAKEIFDALHGKRGVTVGATTYIRVRCRSTEPIFVGFDDRGRPHHTLALLLLKAA